MRIFVLVTLMFAMIGCTSTQQSAEDLAERRRLEAENRELRSRPLNLETKDGKLEIPQPLRVTIENPEDIGAAVGGALNGPKAPVSDDKQEDDAEESDDKEEGFWASVGRWIRNFATAITLTLLGVGVLLFFSLYRIFYYLDKLPPQGDLNQLRVTIKKIDKFFLNWAYKLYRIRHPE